MGTVSFDVPDALHRRFKAVCTMQGRDMKDVIAAFMREYIDENEGELE